MTDAARVIGVVGGGVMGEALISGLLRGEVSGKVIVAERRAERAAELAERYGIEAVSNAEAAACADALILVVKPQDMAELLGEITDHIKPDALVVSLAAGITTEKIGAALPDGPAVVRVMPNTPALVDQGMSAISPGADCSPEQVAEASELLASVGKVLEVPEEYLDAVTAISGSGPAYVFYVVEAMIDAGVLLGLPRRTANELVVQTLLGAATMLRETGEHPTVLRENVSSPGGTTVAAVRQLEERKVHAAFMAAIEAACQRSRELAGGL